MSLFLWIPTYREENWKYFVPICIKFLEILDQLQYNQLAREH